MTYWIGPLTPHWSAVTPVVIPLYRVKMSAVKKLCQPVVSISVFFHVSTVKSVFYKMDFNTEVFSS